MTRRQILLFLLQEIFYQRSVSGNQITSSNNVIPESHSQIMTDMVSSMEDSSDNDTKQSFLNRERRYFPRNRPDNDTKATKQKQKIDENLKLCVFKPTDNT